MPLPSTPTSARTLCDCIDKEVTVLNLLDPAFVEQRKKEIVSFSIKYAHEIPSMLTSLVLLDDFAKLIWPNADDKIKETCRIKAMKYISEGGDCNKDVCLFVIGNYKKDAMAIIKKYANVYRKNEFIDALVDGIRKQIDSDDIKDLMVIPQLHCPSTRSKLVTAMTRIEKTHNGFLDEIDNHIKQTAIANPYLWNNLVNESRKKFNENSIRKKYRESGQDPLPASPWTGQCRKEEWSMVGNCIKKDPWRALEFITSCTRIDCNSMTPDQCREIMKDMVASPCAKQLMAIDVDGNWKPHLSLYAPPEDQLFLWENSTKAYIPNGLEYLEAHASMCAAQDPVLAMRFITGTQWSPDDKNSIKEHYSIVSDAMLYHMAHRLPALYQDELFRHICETENSGAHTISDGMASMMTNDKKHGFAVLSWLLGADKTDSADINKVTDLQRELLLAKAISIISTSDDSDKRDRAESLMTTVK